MTNVHVIRTARPDPLFLFDTRRPMQAATPAMIDRLVLHADQAERLANGHLQLRLSRARASQLIDAGHLDEADHRLGDLTVVWNDVDGQIIQVRDDARLRDASHRWAEWDSLWDAESYVDNAPGQQAAA